MCVKTTMLSLAPNEKFLRFHLQDEHNASYYFKMSWRELPQSIYKDRENLVKVSR